MQALMFAMYFAAITSLTPKECTTQFGEQKQDLLSRYRFGTEQALIQAELLNSMEMVTLQALVLYLVRFPQLYFPPFLSIRGCSCRVLLASSY